jgi:hypothetical protein
MVSGQRRTKPHPHDLSYRVSELGRRRIQVSGESVLTIGTVSCRTNTTIIISFSGKWYGRARSNNRGRER